MMQMVSLRIVALFMMSMLALETAATTLRTQGIGDDDGGDGGGLGGVLAGMMGGAGNGDGGDDADDDDANMVGRKQKKKAPKGSVDASALEKGLKTGGVNQLTMMLKMMRAAQSQPAALQHIIKVNGEDTYDFRDLDDQSTTTFAPITMTEKPTMPPVKFEIAGPSIKLDANGKILGLAAAEMQVAKVGSAAGGQSIAAPQPAVAAPAAFQPAAAAPVVGGATMAQPAPVGVPMMMAMPSEPTSQISAPGGNMEAGLYQGLAQLNQNMNVLMGEAAALAKKAQTPDTGPLATKIDQASQNFLSYEHKMDTRVKALEGENAVLKQQMDEQAQEIKEMEQAVAKRRALRGQVSKGQVLKAVHNKSQNATSSANTSAPSAASETLNSTKQLTKQEVAAVTNGTGQVPKVTSSEAPQPKALKNTTATALVATTLKAPAYATKPWDATFSVHLDGKDGGEVQNFSIRVHPEWAPEAAKRFQDIVQAGILNETRFFRVVPKFMVQFGIPGSPEVAGKWAKMTIPDDPVVKSNNRGMVSFAMSGKNSRTDQMFINYANNEFLNNQGFAPFANVLGDGMQVVDRIQDKYKEKPNQGKIQHHGNKYLKKHFPELSFIDHVDFSLTSGTSTVHDEDHVDFSEEDESSEEDE